jgi:hypothetical protein
VLAVIERTVIEQTVIEQAVIECMCPRWTRRAKVQLECDVVASEYHHALGSERALSIVEIRGGS